MNKRLYRSNKDKMIAGVAGGIGEYFDIDPILVRIAFVILTFVHGIGIIAYIAALFILPKKIDTEFIHPTFNPNPDNLVQPQKVDGKGKIFGSILVIIGAILLLNNLLPSFDFDFVISLILIGLGLFILLNAKKENEVVQ